MPKEGQLQVVDEDSDDDDESWKYLLPLIFYRTMCIIYFTLPQWRNVGLKSGEPSKLSDLMYL